MWTASIKLIAQFRQRLKGFGSRGFEHREPAVAVEILSDIVDPYKIDMVDLHPLEAVLDRRNGAIS